MPADKSGDQEPAEQAPTPPFPPQQQPPLGLESEMEPRPDYGEETYQGYGRLEGKAALITGADSGIGRAVALAFAREGADVLISYLEADSDAQQTVRVVEAAGRRAVAVAAISGRRHTVGTSSPVPSRRLAGWTFWSTTPPSRCPTRASRTCRSRSGTPRSGPTSTPCST